MANIQNYFDIRKQTKQTLSADIYMEGEKRKIQCPKCGENKMIRHCTRKGKIQYRCTKCKGSFTPRSTKPRLDNDREFNSFKKEYIKAKTKNTSFKISELLDRFGNKFSSKTVYNKLPVLNTFFYLYKWFSKSSTPPVMRKRFERDYMYVGLGDNSYKLEVLKIWVRIDTKQEKGVSILIRGDAPLASLFESKTNNDISLENDGFDIIFRIPVPTSTEQLGGVLNPLRRIEQKFPIAGY